MKKKLNKIIDSAACHNSLRFETKNSIKEKKVKVNYGAASASQSNHL
jgi:RNA-binding protein YlmH